MRLFTPDISYDNYNLIRPFAKRSFKYYFCRGSGCDSLLVTDGCKKPFFSHEKNGTLNCDMDVLTRLFLNAYVL